MAADVVIGQQDFTSAVADVSAVALDKPTDVLFTPQLDQLIVADAANHRVLVYDVDPITETLVNGQAAVQVIGQETVDVKVIPEVITPQAIATPTSLAIDQQERLWIADQELHRVIEMVSDEVVITEVSSEVTIVNTCGITISQGANLSYGNIVPGMISQEQLVAIESTGSVDSIVKVQGTNWTDSQEQVQIPVENTKFASQIIDADAPIAVSPVSFEQKQPLSLESTTVSTVAPSEKLITQWQFEADLIDPAFAGSLQQTMDFTVTC
jgi:hypothetical protein